MRMQRSPVVAVNEEHPNAGIDPMIDFLGPLPQYGYDDVLSRSGKFGSQGEQHLSGPHGVEVFDGE